MCTRIQKCLQSAPWLIQSGATQTYVVVSGDPEHVSETLRPVRTARMPRWRHPTHPATVRAIPKRSWVPDGSGLLSSSRSKYRRRSDFLWLRGIGTGWGVRNPERWAGGGERGWTCPLLWGEKWTKMMRRVEIQGISTVSPSEVLGLSDGESAPASEGPCRRRAGGTLQRGPRVPPPSRTLAPTTIQMAGHHAIHLYLSETSTSHSSIL